MAAGDVKSPFTVWGAVNSTDTASKYVNLLYSGSALSAVGAVNYQFSDDLVSGLSVAYNTTDIATQYNLGTSKANGFSLAPYIGVRLTDSLNLDATVGVGTQKNDVTSFSGASTARISSDQFFASVNLVGVRWISDWQLAGKVGYLHSGEKQKSYTDSLNANYSSIKSRTTQLYVGGQVGYWTSGYMPYVGLKYGRDLKHADIKVAAGTTPLPANDKNSLMLDVGVNLFSMKNWSGGLLYSTEQMRKEVKNNSFMANVNYRF